jgi:hypothetical protein
VRAGFFVVVVGFAAASCSFFTVTDDLVEHTASKDGGPPGDGAITDGTSGTDGSSSDTGFCAKQPTSVTFCDDFDGEPFTIKWTDTGLNTRGGGEVSLVTSPFLSAPNALRSHLSQQARNCAFAALEKAIRGGYKAMHGSTDVRYQGPPEVATLMVLGFGNDDDRCEAYVDVQDGKVALYEQVYIGGVTKSDRLRATTLTFPPGTWGRIGADVDWPNQKATVSLDTGSQDLDLFRCPFDTGNVYFQLGYACEQPATADREAHFDNAMVDVR